MRLCLLNYSLPTFRPNCASRLLEQATKWHGRGHSLRQQLSGSVRMDTRSLGPSLAFEGRGNTKPTDGTQRNAGGTRQYGEPWKRRIVEFVCCTRWSGNSHLSSSVQTLRYCRARSIGVQRRLGQRERIHKSFHAFVVTHG